MVFRCWRSSNKRCSKVCMSRLSCCSTRTCSVRFWLNSSTAIATQVGTTLLELREQRARRRRYLRHRRQNQAEHAVLRRDLLARQNPTRLSQLRHQLVPRISAELRHTGDRQRPRLEPGTARASSRQHTEPWRRRLRTQQRPRPARTPGSRPSRVLVFWGAPNPATHLVVRVVPTVGVREVPQSDAEGCTATRRAA